MATQERGRRGLEQPEHVTRFNIPHGKGGQNSQPHSLPEARKSHPGAHGEAGGNGGAEGRVPRLPHTLPAPCRIPFRGRGLGLALQGQVLLPAAAAQQVVRVPTPTLATKPSVHVGAVAAVALAVCTAPTAGVVPLHVLIEADHAGFTQLTHYHFFPVFRFTNMLHNIIMPLLFRVLGTISYFYFSHTHIKAS